MTPFLRKILGMKWLLVFMMYALLIFGVLMIESAARHLSVGRQILEQYGTAGSYYASMQKGWILVGSFVFIVASLIDYRWIRWLGLPFYGVSLGLMVLAIIQEDSVHRLNFGGLQFQPAQLGISSGIVLIAWLMQDLPKWHRWFGLPFVKVGLIGVLSAVPFLIVMKMGDMGSALVWIPVVFTALLISGVPFRYLSFMGFIAAGVLPLLYFVVLPLVSKRGPERIETWLRMVEGLPVNTSAEGYAPHNISMAVGKAGWKGAGWKADNSLHAKAFIPKDTAHNDYIFAVIAEELGFRGSLLLLIVFAVVLVQMLIIAFHSRDVSGRLLTVMIMALFFAHLFESIGMCILLVPITGIPMPLVSYSGTFVVMCMFLLGLVQSVWIHRREEVEVPPQMNPMKVG